MRPGHCPCVAAGLVDGTFFHSVVALDWNVLVGAWILLVRALPMGDVTLYISLSNLRRWRCALIRQQWCGQRGHHTPDHK